MVDVKCDNQDKRKNSINAQLNEIWSSTVIIFGVIKMSVSYFYNFAYIKVRKVKIALENLSLLIDIMANEKISMDLRRAKSQLEENDVQVDIISSHFRQQSVNLNSSSYN